MNISIRKLAMLEKTILEQEATCRLEGYSTSSVDYELKEKITRIMDKVRII